MDTSTIEVVQMLDILRDVGEAHDIKGIVTAMMHRHNLLFRGYAIHGLLITDKDCERWNCLTLQNPERPRHQEPSECDASNAGVTLEQLPGDTGLAEIITALGCDVTELVHSRPALWQALAEQSSTLAITTGSAHDSLHSDLCELLQTNLRTLMASCQTRPLNRGRIWVMLGWEEEKALTDASISLFDLSVEIIVRVGSYLSLYSLLAGLERINQSVRRNIVHDLKTPVSVISGCAGTLLTMEQDEDPELHRELLTCISEQAERLLEDLKEILAPPVEGGWKPHYEEFDLHLLVQKAIMSEKCTERACGHHFEIRGVSAPLMITADRRKMRRVVENLLSNAVKYSPGSKKAVTVTLEEKDGAAILSVEDQGMGMTAEQLARVLEAPGRVVNSELGIEGSGFGLDSCRSVLAAHGGTLQAQSSPGHGSTFTITIPLQPGR